MSLELACIGIVNPTESDILVQSSARGTVRIPPSPLWRRILQRHKPVYLPFGKQELVVLRSEHAVQQDGVPFRNPA